MGSGSNIRLDPDMSDSRDINQIPLSDLYGLPVFAKDTDRKAGERRMEREDALVHIRREVFGVRRCSEKEMLWSIRSQLFQETRDHIVSGAAEKAEVYSETGFFSEFLLMGIFILLLGLRKIRRPKSGVRTVEKLRRKG